MQNNTSLSASNVSNVSIQNCTFTNSTGNAIAFSSSSGSVTNTTITNSNINGNGIWISSSSSVDCKSNTITKTGSGLHTGAGIYYYAGSDGNATQNDISGFNFGLASVRFSSAGSHDSYYHERNNRIRNCNVGLMVGWGSYLYFGDPPPSDYMWNSIYGNTWNAKVGTTWPYQCGLVAYGNWWGAAPPPSNYQVGSSSYFYFTPYLSSDPWAGYSSSSASQPIAEAKITGSKAETATPGPLGQTDPVTTESTNAAVQDSLLPGITLRLQGKRQKARTFFLTWLGQHPNDQRAYLELYHCADSTTTPELIQYFKCLPVHTMPVRDLMLSWLYLRQGDLSSAVSMNNQIIKEQGDSPVALAAELNNFYIDLYNKGDINSVILPNVRTTGVSLLV